LTVAASLLATPAIAQSSANKATEVGVTAKQIHIAVVADVDNSLAPGLFKGAVDGVKAGAAYLNSKAGGGGVAGRKVVVDFYDSKLNPNDARNGTIKACQNDLAMVGTAALFLTSVDDMVNCKDQAGQTTGIADIGNVVTGVPEACAPISFPVVGQQIRCDTITQNPQTYNGQQGEFNWLKKKYKNLHGPMFVSNDTKDAERGGAVIVQTAQNAGIKSDQGSQVAVSAQEPQSAYTGFVQQMKADGSNYTLMTSNPAASLNLRQEATLQGLDASKIVWDTVSAYGNTLLTDNPQSFEGEYQALSFLPFEEKSTNKSLAAFLTYIKQVGGTPDQYSAYSWFGMLAFKDAVNAAVTAHGANGITRASFIDGLKTLTDFNAGGMQGTHSFKTKVTTPCFVEMQFKGGKWGRVYPKKKGTFDCTPSNSVQIKANLLG
jgi:hypothetical protein